MNETTVAPDKTLNELADEAYQNAFLHGWHSAGDSEEQIIERFCNLVHCEVSELYEAYRKDELRAHCGKTCGLNCLEEEMADIVIRVFDVARRLNVDIEQSIVKKQAYNRTRSYRHGDKKA